MSEIFRQICLIEFTEDGLLFDENSLGTTRIKEDALYEGVRISFLALLGTAKVRMQVDVGFDDVIHPAKQLIEAVGDDLIGAVTIHLDAEI